MPVATAGWNPVALRLGVGVVMVVHGLGKLDLGPLANDAGVAGFAGFLASMGVPAPSALAWVVTLVEAGGGVLVLLGVLTRYAAALVALDMAAAFVLVHLPNGFAVSEGGVEFVLVLGLAALALVLSGPGALSLERAVLGRELLPRALASGDAEPTRP